MKRLTIDLFKTVLGLFLYAFGVFLTIYADIGLAPWDCLSMGLSKHLPLSYGAIHTITGVLILIVDLLLREKIGFGTILDALLVGNFVDFFRFLLPFATPNSYFARLPIFLAGLFVMALGQFFYMSAGLGCGPRDSLLIGVGRRVRKIPIGAVEIGILLLILLCGFLSGGPIGLGTVLAVFGTGIAIQLTFRLLRFEPRNVIHRDVLQSIREIKR